MVYAGSITIKHVLTQQEEAKKRAKEGKAPACVIAAPRLSEDSIL